VVVWVGVCPGGVRGVAVKDRDEGADVWCGVRLGPRWV
jgi:hypothetical protein